jgi:hypothetical protein
VAVVAWPLLVLQEMPALGVLKSAEAALVVKGWSLRVVVVIPAASRHQTSLVLTCASTSEGHQVHYAIAATPSLFRRRLAAGLRQLGCNAKPSSPVVWPHAYATML